MGIPVRDYLLALSHGGRNRLRAQDPAFDDQMAALERLGLLELRSQALTEKAWALVAGWEAERRA